MDRRRPESGSAFYGRVFLAAGTVAEALSLLDAGPEGVILDLILPDGDGEVILRKVCDERLPSRVVVCTGVEDRGRLGAIERLGAHAVLRKPIRSRAILQCFGGFPPD